MAKNRGWWKLTLSGNSHEDLSDVDREHIASLILEGYIEGEVAEGEATEDNGAAAEPERDIHDYRS